MAGSSLCVDEAGQEQVNKLAQGTIAPGGREMCSWEQEEQVVTRIPLAGMGRGSDEAGGVMPEERAVIG